MRKLPRSQKAKENYPQITKGLFKVKFTGINDKIAFRCDVFLLEKIKNALTSQHLAGNYEYANLSIFFRSALQAYQKGMPLTYQREINNPKKEIIFRLGEELMTFYNSLPARAKTTILERVLGSYFYRVLS
jgi:hypothetical protein